MTPQQKEEHYKIYHHLFGVASGEEIKKNGLNIGETMAGITQNVEENSLDIIDQDKEINELKAELAAEKQANQELREENREMKKDIKDIKKLLKQAGIK